jgi:hypothetical protein
MPAHFGYNFGCGGWQMNGPAPFAKNFILFQYDKIFFAFWHALCCNVWHSKDLRRAIFFMQKMNGVHLAEAD